MTLTQNHQIPFKYKNNSSIFLICFIIFFIETYFFPTKSPLLMNGKLNESDVTKEYEFIKPETNEVDYLLDKVIKDCKKSFPVHLNIDVCMVTTLTKKLS